MYVCGITPYDATHIGHAATYVAFDLLNRAWRDAGHEVRYVQNVTDVDDPLLERATATGVDWVELAERETELFRDDMTALRVLAPDDYVGAVESIPLVVEMVQRLQQRGARLRGRRRPVLLGALRPAVRLGVEPAPRTRCCAVFAERGGDPDRPGKKDPLDCLLWQAERPGRAGLGHRRSAAAGPAGTSSARRSRCTTSARSFDVQGGGSDLVFPHHEMSASEAQAAFDGLTFARAYVHAGMVGYQGEKMSKSKGNLVLVSRLREAGVDPMAIRLALLAHHYRSDWEWTDADLAAAQDRLAAWRAAVDGASRDQAERSCPPYATALADDLDAPAALAAVDAWAAGRRAVTARAPTLVPTLLDARLGSCSDWCVRSAGCARRSRARRGARCDESGQASRTVSGERADPP